MSHRFVGQLLCFCFIGLGWLASGYLLWRVFSLSAGAAIGADVCSALFGSTCDRTLLSPDSFQLGYPLAGWGLVYFAVLGFLLALGLHRTTLLVCAGGVGSSVVLTLILLGTKVQICFLCLTIHAMNLALLLALLGLLKPAVTPEQDEAPPPDTKARWRKLALAMVGVGALIQTSLWWFDDSFENFMMDRRLVLASFLAEPQKQIPADRLDASLGPENAPVQIVVFSSFQCPGCRKLALQSKRIVEYFGDQVSITYKNFPLSTKCNPKIKNDMQPRACEAAWAAQAAGQQDLFWPFHDRLFDSDLMAEETTLKNVARDTKLDLEKWQADRQSEDVKAKLERDIALGILLGVDETPSVFLNGRRLRPYRPAVLEFLIKEELKKSAPAAAGKTAEPKESPAI
jgi:protein-disulfide isomerase